MPTQHGSQIELFRWGSQADEPDRKAPGWFVTARGERRRG
jgi:hypothetical protein